METRKVSGIVKLKGMPKAYGDDFKRMAIQLEDESWHSAVQETIELLKDVNVGDEVEFDELKSVNKNSKKEFWNIIGVAVLRKGAKPVESNAPTLEDHVGIWFQARGMVLNRLGDLEKFTPEEINFITSTIVKNFLFKYRQK